MNIGERQHEQQHHLKANNRSERPIEDGVYNQHSSHKNSQGPI